MNLIIQQNTDRPIRFSFLRGWVFKNKIHYFDSAWCYIILSTYKYIRFFFLHAKAVYNKA
jgi:hypothetical protein